MKNRLILQYCLLVFLLAPLSAYAEGIRFGVSSMLSPGETLSHYAELNNYIAKELSTPSTLVHDNNYSAMNRQLENNKVHFASICSGALLDLDPDAFRFLAIPVVRGQSTYRSYIIVNKTRNIQSLDDIDKDVIFGLTDQLSNTGALYPKYLFAKRGQQLEKLVKKVYFTGSHDNSIYLTNRGVIDAAAVDNLIFAHIQNQTPQKIANIQVIHKSPAFPIPPIVASTKLSFEKFNQLQNILIHMHQSERGKQILNGLKIDQFMKPEGMNYQIIKEMKQFIDENAAAYSTQNSPE